MSKVEDRGQRRRIVELSDLPDAPLRHVARPNHEVPAVGQQRRDEIVVVIDVVFEVGILKEHDIARTRRRDPS